MSSENTNVSDRIFNNKPFLEWYKKMFNEELKDAQFPDRHTAYGCFFMFRAWEDSHVQALADYKERIIKRLDEEIEAVKKDDSSKTDWELGGVTGSLLAFDRAKKIVNGGKG